MPLVARHVPVTTLAAAAVLATVAWACEDGAEDPAPTPDAAAPPTASEVIQRGSVVVAQSNAPLEGATVTVGSRSVTSAADGTYALPVPRGVPYAMRIEAPDHYTLLEQEWVAGADVSRTGSTMLPNNVASFLAALLPNRDATKGVLVVRVNAVRGCADADGATVSLAAAGAEVRYFAGSLPSPNATSVSASEVLSAVFYNVPVDTPIVVAATSPKCAPLPFPVTEDGVTYTGNVVAKAGEALAYARVFLGGGASDGGVEGSAP